jgi:hypothetical protein
VAVEVDKGGCRLDRWREELGELSEGPGEDVVAADRVYSRLAGLKRLELAFFLPKRPDEGEVEKGLLLSLELSGLNLSAPSSDELIVRIEY